MRAVAYLTLHRSLCVAALCAVHVATVLVQPGPYEAQWVQLIGIVLLIATPK